MCRVEGVDGGCLEVYVVCVRGVCVWCVCAGCVWCVWYGVCALGVCHVSWIERGLCGGGVFSPTHSYAQIKQTHDTTHPHTPTLTHTQRRTHPHTLTHTSHTPHTHTVTHRPYEGPNVKFLDTKFHDFFF